MRRSMLAMLVAAVPGAAVLMSATVNATDSADGLTTAYVLSDVQCDPGGDGVVDLVFVNDHESTDAHFAIAGVTTRVAPRSARAVTYPQLSDGDVDIPVLVDGVESRVHLSVHCDLPLVEVAPPPVPLRPGGTGGVLALSEVPAPSAVRGPLLPATGSDGLLSGVAALMTGAGALVTLLARRRSVDPDA